MKERTIFLFYAQFVVCIFGINAVSTSENNYETGKADPKLVDLINKATFQDYSGLNLTTLNGNDLVTLVSAAYAGNLQHTSSIINFIQTTQVGKNKYNGYATLAEEMTKNGHRYTAEMLKLVYFVKLAMNEATTDEKLSISYKQLKKTFPVGIQAVMFGQIVTIWNSARREYMYQADYDKVDGYYLTWRSGNQVLQGDFTLVPGLDTNNDIYFEIINQDSGNHDGGYMCLSGDYYDGGGNTDRQKVVKCFIFPPYFLPARWYLVPNGNYFTIRSSSGRTLYAPDDNHVVDSTRRWLLAWPSNVANGLWRIS